MKGVSIAIETVIYLILAVTVLSVLLLFFLKIGGPAQDQYTLEATRNTLCGVYTSQDFACVGKGDNPVSGMDPKKIEELVNTCRELNRRGFAYLCSGPATGSEGLKCIQDCCLTCPNKPSRP